MSGARMLVTACIAIILPTLSVAAGAVGANVTGQDLGQKPRLTNVLVDQDGSLAEVGLVRLRISTPDDALEISGGRPMVLRDGATIRIGSDITLRGVCRIRAVATAPLILRRGKDAWAVAGGRAAVELAAGPTYSLSPGVPVPIDVDIILRMVFAALDAQLDAPSPFRLSLAPPKQRLAALPSVPGGRGLPSGSSFLVYEPDPVTPWQASGKEKPLSFSADGTLQDAELLVMGFEKGVRIPASRLELSTAGLEPDTRKQRTLETGWTLPTRITVIATVKSGTVYCLPQKWDVDSVEISQRCEQAAATWFRIADATLFVSGSSGIWIDGAAMHQGAGSTSTPEPGSHANTMYLPLPSSEQFVRMLGDKEPSVRRIAAFALGEIAPRSATGSVGQALAKETDEACRRAIQDALTRIGTR